MDLVLFMNRFSLSDTRPNCFHSPSSLVQLQHPRTYILPAFFLRASASQQTPLHPKHLLNILFLTIVILHYTLCIYPSFHIS